MTEADSLCRIDWKLGQALMPAHFLWQEDSLRHEWELRFFHQSMPMWGVVDLGWDEVLLRTTGRFRIDRLQLVFETGQLVDVPGNARPVSLDLPKPADEPIDLFLHHESDPGTVKSSRSDKEGSLVELRIQKLALATSPLKTPLPGVHLLRLRPWSDAPADGPALAPTGWTLDPDYVPPLVNVFGLREFGLTRFSILERCIESWKATLRQRAVENTLGVHKRVEASMYLRRAQSLSWYLRQVAPVLTPADAPRPGPDRRQAPAVLAHPFELFQRLVDLYLDVFAFRCGPLQTLQKAEPVPCVYQHDDLAGSFRAVEKALQEELSRPGAGSPHWTFARDPRDSERLVCKFPEGIAPEAELYWLVQFEADGAEAARADGLDPRLLGLKLAAPERLDTVTRRVLPGIPFERVRLVPFPHDFDPRVQFYRLKHGPEWTWAHAAGAIAYCPGKRGIDKSFLYSPDVRA